MTIDDPRLTAYAFDELDPAERAAVEAEIAADPARAAEVAELRALAARLRAELAAEESLELTEERRTATLAAARSGAAAPRRFFRNFRVWLPTAIAAGLMLILWADFYERRGARAPATDGLIVRDKAVPDSEAARPEAPLNEAKKELAPQPAAPMPFSSQSQLGIQSAGSSAGERRADAPAAEDHPVEDPQRNSGSIRAGEESGVVVAEGMVRSAPASAPAAPAAAPAPLPTVATPQEVKPSGTARSTFAKELPQAPAKRLVEGAAPARVAAKALPYEEQPFIAVTTRAVSALPLNPSTADPALYPMERRNKVAPPRDEVQIGRLVNSFAYAFPPTRDDLPCAVVMEVASCPWEPSHLLVRVGLQARAVAAAQPGVPLDEVSAVVRFNPQQVAAYRRLGDETPVLADAPMAAAAEKRQTPTPETDTSLYEIVPTPAVTSSSSGFSTRQTEATLAGRAGGAARAPELLSLKLNWNDPAGGKASTRVLPLTDARQAWQAASPDFHWAAAVAGYGLLRRDSPYKGSATWELVRELGEKGKTPDRDGRRRPFLRAIEEASKAAAPAK